MITYRIKSFGSFGEGFVVIDQDGKIMAKGRPATSDKYGSWIFGNDGNGYDEFVDRESAMKYAKRKWGVSDHL